MCTYVLIQELVWTEKKTDSDLWQESPFFKFVAAEYLIPITKKFLFLLRYKTILDDVFFSI